MAKLGFRTVDEMVGRVDMLDAQPADRPLEGERARSFGDSLQSAGARARGAALHDQAQDHGLEQALDHKLIDKAQAGAREADAG